MAGLQKMSYNLRAGKKPAYYLWIGYVSCLVLYPLSARHSLRTFCSRPARRSGARPFLISHSKDTNLPCWCMRTLTCRMSKQANRWVFRDVRSGVGASAGPLETFPSQICQGEVERQVFPPLDHALVKAVACELVAETEQPLSRQSLADVTARASRALSQPISRSTVWRILDTDAIKPWRYKYWIFPRNPQFAEKASPILDLDAGIWEGQALGPKDYILSADEKTSIQARYPAHPALSPAPGRPTRIENEYQRGGALQYLAAWDVRRGYVMGRCEPNTGIEPFGRLVDQVLSEEPYCSAERLFWIVDNGSSHRGEAAKKRLRQIDPRIIVVHTPALSRWHLMAFTYQTDWRKVASNEGQGCLVRFSIGL